MLGSSMINAAASLLSLLAGFASSVIVARLLGVEGAGTVAYALWIMTAGTLVADLGLPQALLRFVGRNAEESASLVRALGRRFSLASALLASVLLGFALFRYGQGAMTQAWVWVASAGLYLAYAYSTLALGVEQGLGKFRQASGRTAVGCLVQPFSVALGAVLFGPAGAISGHVFRHLPQVLALRHYFPGEARKKRQAVPAVVSAYARNNWISGGLTVLLASRVEFAIIGFYFSVSEVGQYATGATMAGMIVQLAFALVAVLVPLFASYHDRGDRPGLIRSYQRSLMGMSLLLAPICFGGGAIAPVLVPALFGPAFGPAGQLAAILVPFTFAQVLTTVSYRMMLAQERSKAVLQFSLWEGALCMIALMIVVPIYGPVGAAWVKGLTATASAVLHLAYCWRRLDVPFHPVVLLKVTLAAALCAGTAATLLMWEPDLVGLALAIPASAVVYVALVILLRVVPQEERRVVAHWSVGKLPAFISSRLRRTVKAPGPKGGSL